MIGPLKNLFKGQSYYLELDESKPVSNETATPAPVVEEKPKPVEPIAPTPTVEVEPEPVKAETVKPAKKADTKKATAKVEAIQPASVSSNVSNPLDTIKAMVQKPTSQAQTKSEKSAATFAPDYLMYTKTQVKRRPGACMDSFLNMARQIR